MVSTIKNQTWGPASILVIAIALVAGIVGGIVTITNPSTLPFRDYLTDLVLLAGSGSLLGVGRGIAGSKIGQTILADAKPLLASVAGQDVEKIAEALPDGIGAVAKEVVGVINDEEKLVAVVPAIPVVPVVPIKAETPL